MSDKHGAIAIGHTGGALQQIVDWANQSKDLEKIKRESLIRPPLR